LESVGHHFSQIKEGEIILRNKFLKSFCLSLVLTLAYALALPVIAQNVTRTLVFSRQAKIGSQAVSQGKYSAAFDDKKDGELTLSKDGKEVLKASYKLVELGKPAAESAVVFILADDGSFKVRRIEIKGLKSALQFE